MTLITQAHPPSATWENTHCPHYSSLLVIMDLQYCFIFLPHSKTGYHPKDGDHVHKGKETNWLTIAGSAEIN